MSGTWPNRKGLSVRIAALVAVVVFSLATYARYRWSWTIFQRAYLGTYISTAVLPWPTMQRLVHRQDPQAVGQRQRAVGDRLGRGERQRQRQGREHGVGPSRG